MLVIPVSLRSFGILLGLRVEPVLLPSRQKPCPCRTQESSEADWYLLYPNCTLNMCTNYIQEILNTSSCVYLQQ